MRRVQRQSIWRGGFDNDAFVPIRKRCGGGVSSSSQTTGVSALQTKLVMGSYFYHDQFQGRCLVPNRERALTYTVYAS